MQRSIGFALLSIVLLVLGLSIGPASAQEAPSSPQTGPCAPGAVYDPACDVDHDNDVDIFDVQLAAGHWNQGGIWTGGDYWALAGNAGTTPGTHFLGTTDNQALQVRVNGSRALLIQPTGSTSSPNLIGGYSGNSVSAGVVGVTIGGGGENNFINSVTYSFGTVSGGRGNTASDYAATVGGGESNTASGGNATVGGGWYNDSSGYTATVGGGENNTASEYAATVGGGLQNDASGGNATVGGGSWNVASGPAATVGGGAGNTASGVYVTVGGGQSNTASAEYDTVSGGYVNTASGWFATVAGGGQNTASGDGATVGGGEYNTASAPYAAVPAGKQGVASHFGELAYASGGFAADGDAQTSLFVLRRETGDATLTELFLDGVDDRITLAADRVMTFDILVVASHRSGSGNSAGYQVVGVIRNIGGTTSFVGTPIVTVLGENLSGWDVQVEASDTLDALLVKVQGSSALTVRWVASVRTVEVGR